MQASRSGSKTDDDGSICVAPMSLDSVLLTTACNHQFHVDCLPQQIQESLNNECPLNDVLRNGVEQDQVLQQSTFASKIRRRASNQPGKSQVQYHFEKQQNVSYVARLLREELETRMITSIAEIR